MTVKDMVKTTSEVLERLFEALIGRLVPLPGKLVYQCVLCVKWDIVGELPGYGPETCGSQSCASRCLERTTYSLITLRTYVRSRGPFPTPSLEK